MPRNYNHNVDIKSTQLGNAVSTTGKFLAVTALGGLSLIIIAFISAASNSVKEKNESDKIANSAAKLDLTLVGSDYIENPMRYQRNWAREYLSYSGQISKIGNYTLEFNHGYIRTSGGNGQYAKVICDMASYDERTKASMLDRGNFANVVGRLTTYYQAEYPGKWEFKLEDCRIK